jgi:hypothetical protein
MARTVPWHSAHEAVYHNNTICSGGRAANVAGSREGSSGKRLCAECEQLNIVAAVPATTTADLDGHRRR